MSDKTDPRLDYERRTIPIDDDALASEVAAAHLARLDVADRAAGIVRVDTKDEALVERLADKLFGLTIAGAYVGERDRRYFARAVLAALREAS